MANLNWNIGRVNESNDALVSWAISDISTLAGQTAASVVNIFSPTAHAVVDNTTTLVRKPIQTIWTAENYGKLARTVPAVPLDMWMKALRFPVSALDNGLNYLVNNNLERGVEAVKSVTTNLVSNIITNNGQTRFKALKALGGLVKWAGDIMGTLIKTPTGALAAGTSILDKYLAKGTSFTEKFLNKVRVTDKNFISLRPFINSADMPQVANAER